MKKKPNIKDETIKFLWSDVPEEPETTYLAENIKMEAELLEVVRRKSKKFYHGIHHNRARGVHYCRYGAFMYLCEPDGSRLSLGYHELLPDRGQIGSTVFKLDNYRMADGAKVVNDYLKRKLDRHHEWGGL
ncbi:MAG: hypothetical protein GY853_14550 [PVC group bacterium]|nr:hypothetical protein [PVC group bacterium]